LIFSIGQHKFASKTLLNCKDFQNIYYIAHSNTKNLLRGRPLKTSAVRRGGGLFSFFSIKFQ